MSAPSSASSISSSEVLSEDIIKCLSLFRNGKTDNEKLASLMLIAKLSKSNELNLKARRRIYESIGFDFINRLLTTNISEDGHMLHHIAVAILSCYCTDPELVLHPQVTSKTISLNQFISATKSASVLIQDCLHCFMCTVQTSKGAEYLWKYNTLPSLLQCFIIHRETQDFCINVLVQFLSFKDVIIHDQLGEALTDITVQFKECHDETKFDICRLLTLVIDLDCMEQLHECNSWQCNVGSSLYDILQSKLDINRRQMALNLCGTMCQRYGLEWALLVHERFLLLLTHLSSIEVQVVLDDMIDYSDPPIIMVSCFYILENVIILMAASTSEDENVKMPPSVKISEEGVLQLHTVLLEGQLTVVKSLKSFEGQGFSDTVSHLNYLSSLIRFLGAWLAEDSLSLSDELYSLLPFLLNICLEHDLLKFLLPGYSNLVTDSKPREILIKNGLMEVLFHHVEKYSKGVNNDSNLLDQVISVMLTLLLSDTSVLCCHDNSSCQWLVMLSNIITKTQSGIDYIELVQLSLVYLIIMNRSGSKSTACGPANTINVIIGILSRTISLIDSDLWTTSLSELWHISMLELKKCSAVDVLQSLNDYHPFDNFMTTIAKGSTVSSEVRAASSIIASLYEKQLKEI